MQKQKQKQKQKQGQGQKQKQKQGQRQGQKQVFRLRMAPRARHASLKMTDICGGRRQRLGRILHFVQG